MCFVHVDKLRHVRLQPNTNKLIRVELSDDVLNGQMDPSALPCGFRGMHHLVTSGSSILHDPTLGDVIEDDTGTLIKAIEIGRAHI